MEWLWWTEWAALLLVVVQFVRLLLADADLTLLWKERFGRKPEEMAGQVVWITGASAGIGEHLAYELARAGCKLILSARREEELNRVKAKCLSLSSRLKDADILVLPLDLLKYDTHKPAVDKVINHFHCIDILVNNSGRSQRAWAKETTLDVDRQIWELNVLGTLSLTKAVLPHMLSRKAGHLVVTSSVAGKLGAPLSAVYSATKFALQGWFDALRLETSDDNIDITMVCPGPVHSDVGKMAFTDTSGEIYGYTEASGNKMDTKRCASLMAVAMANRLDEVWISKHPVLLFTYVSQYMPSVSRWLGKKFGKKALLKLRQSGAKGNKFN